MAQLGKFERTILDNEGNPLSGISVAIYSQGATLSASGSNPYTVYDPGALTTSHTVQANTNDAITKSVTVVAATSITVQGIGLGSLVANDRLVPISPTPTLYFDSTGTTSTGSNVLTTDANGYCTCWIVGGAYDIIISGTGYSTRLVTDFIVAAEDRISNAFDSTTNPAWKFGTTRTVASSPLHEWHNPRGTRKCYITPAGGFNGVTGTFSGAVSLTSTLTVTGATTLGAATAANLTVTGATSVGALTGTSTGTFASTLTASSGFTMTAGTFSVPANTISKTYMATGTTDQTVTAGAGYTTITGDGNGSLVAVNVANAAAASEYVVICVVPIDTTGAGATYAQARIKNGGTVLHEDSAYMAFGAADLGSVMTMIARQTGLTGSNTWTLEVQTTTTSGKIKSNTTDRKAKLIVIEHKF